MGLCCKIGEVGGGTYFSLGGVGVECNWVGIKHLL